MKFVHLADVHLGCKPDQGFVWSEEREKNIYDTFLRVIDFCNENQVELLLIAGDLYHRQPTETEVKDLSQFFLKLKHTYVVMIAGERDYMESSSRYYEHIWPEYVKILSPKDIEEYYIEEIETYLYGYSYEQQQIKENRLSKIRSNGKEGYHILLAHGGDQNHNPLEKNAFSEADFDYIALGHIHKPGRVSEKSAYAGSLEPIDKTELGAHGFILGTLKTLNKKRCHLQFVEFAKWQYKVVKVCLDNNMSLQQIYEYVKEILSKHEKNQLIKLIIEGFIDSDLTLEGAPFYELGNVVEVKIHTSSDYDYMKLYYENKDNILGMYIETIRHLAVNEEQKDLALYYGVKALLESDK